MSPKRILVVDDEWDEGALLTFLLEGEGHRVEYAHDGLAALQVIRTKTVDLVITDFMMPVLDGCALIRTMRANKEMKTIPVMMVSALREVVVREKCDTVRDFLHKPFSPEQLLAQVRALLLASETRD